MNEIICGDCLEELKKLESESVDCCITSPPYFGLRDYGVVGQIGLEDSMEDYVEKLVLLFRELRRVLKTEGTFWLNLGDSYATDHIQGNTDAKMGWKSGEAGGERQRHHGWANGGNLPSKNIMGIPWRVAFALQADGWWLRQDIIWAKPNPMPESVTDRCTKSHEYIFLLAKSPKYYFDNEAIKEKVSYAGFDRGISNNISPKGITPFGGRTPHKGAITPGQSPQGKALKRMNGEKDCQYDNRNKRSVWTVTTKPFSDAHFATFPKDLIEPMVKAGCPKRGLVLDPFMGSGTTALVARNLGRNYLGIELNPAYIKIAEKRLAQQIMI